MSHLRCAIGKNSLLALGCKVSTDWVKHDKAVNLIDDGINRNASAVLSPKEKFELRVTGCELYRPLPD